MLFLLFAGAITLAVAASLARPLLAASTRAPSADAFNVQVYRDQLAELDRDAERGLIGEKEAAAARAEIARRLLAAQKKAEADPDAAASPGRSAGGAPFAIGLGLCLPVLAGGLYLAMGAPGMGDQPLSERQARVAGAASTEDAQMRDLVGQLAQYLQANPSDGQSWAVLGRSLVQLGRPGEAVQAYARARALSEGDPSLNGAYAEARILANDGWVDPEAKAALETLNAANPADPQARYYLALAQAQAGDRAGALAAWQALLADSEPDAVWRPAVERQIAALTGRDDEAPFVAPGTTMPQPSEEQVAAAAALSAEERAQMIEGMVAGLAARLEQDPDDLEGWKRLARAYDVLGRSEDAFTAHGEVLARDPNDQAALWALGSQAAASDDPDQARALWTTLLEQLEPGTPEYQRVADALARLTP